MRGTARLQVSEQSRTSREPTARRPRGPRRIATPASTGKRSRRRASMRQFAHSGRDRLPAGSGESRGRCRRCSHLRFPSRSVQLAHRRSINDVQFHLVEPRLHAVVGQLRRVDFCWRSIFAVNLFAEIVNGFRIVRRARPIAAAPSSNTTSFKYASQRRQRSVASRSASPSVPRKRMTSSSESCGNSTSRCSASHATGSALAREDRQLGNRRIPQRGLQHEMALDLRNLSLADDFELAGVEWLAVSPSDHLFGPAHMKQRLDHIRPRLHPPGE